MFWPRRKTAIVSAVLMRSHDVRTLTAGELERARRDLAVSLALVRPDSPARVPIIAQITAIDTELAGHAETD
jgi:hypothetical protein